MHVCESCWREVRLRSVADARDDERDASGPLRPKLRLWVHPQMSVLKTGRLPLSRLHKFD